MPFLRNITSGLRSLFRKNQVDRELDEELGATRNNKTRAAELLGISLKTLHNKLKEYGGDRPDSE
jgi:DNA-binding NtrC family response regulator